MAEDEHDNGFDRLDRKIGTAWSRAGALLFVGVAFVISYSTLGSEDFALATHWPGLVATCVLLFLARLCYRSREGMLSLLSDVGAEKKLK